MKDYISIGITGGIGSGKSYVCQILSTMGYPVFNSDAEAKKIISTDPKAISEIMALFGENAYSKGYLNRAFLADQIFHNPGLRTKMNKFVHPLVRSKYKDWAANAGSTIVFNEAAILFETGAHKNFDKVILITAPEELRIERIKKRDGASGKDIKARISTQWSDEKKAKLAHFIVKNDNTAPLLPQLLKILEEV